MRLKRQEQHLKGEPKEALLYALSRMDALCEAENLEKISTAADAAALQESFPTITQEKLMWLQDLLQELTFIVIWHQMRQLVRAALNVCGIAMEDASAKTN